MTVRGEIEVEALGKVWRLKFGHAAYEAVEVEMGKRFDKVMEMFSREDVSMMQLIRVMMKAGLRRHHPDLTNDDVCDIIDACGVAVAAEKVQAAIEASAPKEAKGGANPR